jgi:hypothetical protein
MSLGGEAAVAIWHDIAPEGRDEFYAWHGHEHMPERVSIPGFLRGRRYVAVHGAPEFFNLYEIDTAATLVGEGYLARLNAPTPWTVSTVRHFRNVARSLCRVAAGAGDGEGGLVATFRYDVEASRAVAHRERLAGEALPRLAQAAGVAGAHLLVADEAASAVETVEKRVRAEKNLIPRWIVLVEGWGDAEPFRARCAALASEPLFAEAIEPPLWALYTLQNARSSLAPARG